MHDDPRINQYLARCGLGSRRACEQFVRDGRVTLNGERVESLSVHVPPDARVTLDGQEVRPGLERVYLAFHKPVGVTTTLSDPHAERTLAEFLKDQPEGVVPAGRLDRESEGLLILSNDGDLIQRLTHPSHEMDKVYWVKMNQPVPESAITNLAEGVTLEEGRTKPAHVARIPGSDPSWIAMTLQQGWKRQIRRMAEVVGLKVSRLIRREAGPVKLGTLRPGQLRQLKPRELSLLGVSFPQAEPGKAAPNQRRATSVKTSRMRRKQA